MQAIVADSAVSDVHKSFATDFIVGLGCDLLYLLLSEQRNQTIQKHWQQDS
jgi:hypothetical protein